MSESPTKSDEKQLGGTSDVITPAESELGNELNNSVVSAIMADVATASTVVTGGSGDSGTSSQCQRSGNRQETKIEEERDSNEEVSSRSGLMLPVSQDGEKGNEKPWSSAGFDGRAPGGGGRKRKRKEMEGRKNKWASRREAEPKRKKVM